MMDWPQVLTLIVALFGLALTMIGTTWAMHRQSYNEMKDFHGRLCTLEERYLLLMQRVLEKEK